MLIPDRFAFGGSIVEQTRRFISRGGWMVFFACLCVPLRFQEVQRLRTTTGNE